MKTVPELLVLEAWVHTSAGLLNVDHVEYRPPLAVVRSLDGLSQSAPIERYKWEIQLAEMIFMFKATYGFKIGHRPRALK